ncbi:MAG: phytoene desaturase family protein [Panacagrimonas sp.]
MSRLEQPDVIVVGAGHNTLTAAAYLAACGLGVLVLERNEIAGGGAVSKSLTLPGFIHDTHATAVVHLQGHPLLKNDELKLKSKFGLKFVFPDSSFMTLFDDGDTLSCYLDLDRTCAEIARYSRKDADAYRAMAVFMNKLGPMISMSMAKPPLPFGRFISFLEQSDIGQEMLMAMLRSSYDLVIERFEHPKVRLHFLKWMAEMTCSPEEKTTGMTLLFLIYSSHSNPAGCVVGGSQNLTAAMIRCIEHHGGEVRTGSTVRRILNKDGIARAVELEDGQVLNARLALVAAIHPHALDDMVPGLDAGLVERARNVELSSYGIFLINAALREKPVWNVGQAPEDCLCVNYVDYTSVEDFRGVFDDLKYGKLPTHFCGYTSVHTIYEPSRAPAGQHTLYFAGFAPRELKDTGLEGWDAIKEARADWMMQRLARYAPNISGSNILARHADSPLDMERHSPSFRRGDVVGVAMFIYQFFGRRPTPELAQYRVPGAEGLYLSGPFMHPGGGLTGGGRATAIRMMEDLGVEYSHVITS